MKASLFRCMLVLVLGCTLFYIEHASTRLVVGYSVNVDQTSNPLCCACGNVVEEIRDL